MAKFRESFSTLTIIPKSFSAASFLRLVEGFFSTERQTFTIENLFLVPEYDKSSYLVIGCCKDNGFGPHQMPVSAMLIFSLLRGTKSKLGTYIKRQAVVMC